MRFTRSTVVEAGSKQFQTASSGCAP